MIRPYGSWPSPITAESLTQGTVGIGDPIFDGTDLYWLEADPTDGGRISIRRWTENGDLAVTGAPYNVRSRVHEYGGGPYAVADRQVLFSNFADNAVYLVTEEAPPRALTDDPQLRYGALQLFPDRDLMIAVREDHRPSDREPINTIIARRLSAPAGTADTVLCAGADFYASPTLGADGRLAWIEWDHPNMPWDSTRLMVADLPSIGDDLANGRPDDPLITGQLVAGGPAESVAVPRWLPDGTLIFVSDRTDWWNLYRHDGSEVTALCPLEAEFAPPQWMLGSRPYVIMDGDRIACTWTVGNRSHLGVLTIGDGRLEEIAIDAVSIGPLTTDGQRIAAVLGHDDRDRDLAMIDITDPAAAKPEVLTRSSETELPAGLVSTATEVHWTSNQGPVHGWFYPPQNDGWQAPDAELPPMITISHGGPTGGSAPEFRSEVQFWTSRGIAVLDVNYGGSTGYGRRYRERLHRAWGEVDVTDCVAGASAMADQGRVDRERLAIMGSSAGGYTTLRALTTSTVFTAGISKYGIGDLTALVADTHKFESRYPESLIGAYPAEAELYADRSPINHVDRLQAPILLLQGSEDRVVPPNQAMTFADAARQKGLPVALIMYEGEGHGFRRAENIIAAQQAELAFLGRVFGFTPADDLPDLVIENL
jgi:dipeptidyl aminopeptidase/acylaminoacyl peptidase